MVGRAWQIPPRCNTATRPKDRRSVVVVGTFYKRDVWPLPRCSYNDVKKKKKRERRSSRSFFYFSLSPAPAAAAAVFFAYIFRAPRRLRSDCWSRECSFFCPPMSKDKFRFKIWDFFFLIKKRMKNARLAWSGRKPWRLKKFINLEQSKLWPPRCAHRRSGWKKRLPPKHAPWKNKVKKRVASHASRINWPAGKAVAGLGAVVRGGGGGEEETPALVFRSARRSCRESPPSRTSIKSPSTRTPSLQTRSRCRSESSSPRRVLPFDKVGVPFEWVSVPKSDHENLSSFFHSQIYYFHHWTIAINKQSV